MCLAQKQKSHQNSYDGILFIPNVKYLELSLKTPKVSETFICVTHNLTCAGSV